MVSLAGITFLSSFLSDNLELNLIIVPNQTSQLMKRIDQSVVGLYGTIIGPTGLSEMEADYCR